jgi:hypothetical protein
MEGMERAFGSALASAVAVAASESESESRRATAVADRRCVASIYAQAQADRFALVLVLGCGGSATK